MRAPVAGAAMVVNGNGGVLAAFYFRLQEEPEIPVLLA
jgi:hypothetical protein